MIGTDGERAGVYALRCRRWSCKRCGPFKRRSTRRRIDQGLGLGTPRFFTVTSPADEDLVSSFDELGHRWKLLHQRIGRRFRGFEFVAIAEAQPGRGAAHLHVVFRGPYLPQAWLSRAAAESGFGPIVDVRRPRGDIARYLVKDLGPDARYDLPRGFHRVRWSRGWAPVASRAPSRRWGVWWIAHGPLAAAVRSAIARGYILEEVAGTPTDWGSEWRQLSWKRLGHDPGGT